MDKHLQVISLHLNVRLSSCLTLSCAASPAIYALPSQVPPDLECHKEDCPNKTFSMRPTTRSHNKRQLTLFVAAGEQIAGIVYQPESLQGMRENLERVLQFMASKKIRMHSITSKEVLEGNLKAVMRLILALAAHYKPQSVKHHDVSYEQMPEVNLRLARPNQRPATPQTVSFSGSVSSSTPPSVDNFTRSIMPGLPSRPLPLLM